MNHTFNIGDKIKLPNDLKITARGASCLDYKIVDYEIVGLGTERIILKRGRRLHDKYIDTVEDILNEISKRIKN